MELRARWTLREAATILSRKTEKEDRSRKNKEGEEEIDGVDHSGVISERGSRENTTLSNNRGRWKIRRGSP